MKCMRLVEARYEEGLLRPEKPLSLRQGEQVALIVVRRPDPRRWNLERLAKSGKEEDLGLAEEGLAEWADALDEEDRRFEGARSGGQTSVLIAPLSRPVAAR